MIKLKIEILKIFIFEFVWYRKDFKEKIDDISNENISDADGDIDQQQ
jgi:hypothetical protein